MIPDGWKGRGRPPDALVFLHVVWFHVCATLGNDSDGLVNASRHRGPRGVVVNPLFLWFQACKHLLPVVVKEPPSPLFTAIAALHLFHDFAYEFEPFVHQHVCGVLAV